MRHLGLEFTNYCNLACENCPNAYTTISKGYATQETLELTIEHGQEGQIFQLHGLGEPLLHREVVRFTKMVADSDKKFFVSMSTNGLLLTYDMLIDLLDVGLNELFVSLHTPASVDALIRAARVVKHYDREVRLVGTHYNGNTPVEEYLALLSNYDAQEFLEKHLEPPIDYFTWSGTVKGTQIEFPPDVVADRLSRCWFIRNDICAIVRWDGTVNACCYDFNNVNRLGHISEFAELRHMPETYDLCRFCEPKMANDFR